MLGQRAAELDLARGVGAVAELVLQALQLEARVARAVGQHARQREAGDALVGLREDEEEVAHRRAAEPLVAGELPPAVVAPRSARVVLARTSEPPCFSVIAMPHSALAFSAAGLQLGVVGRGGQPRDPLGRDVGLRAQRGDGGEGHRDRAAEARLGLARADVGAPRARRGRPAGRCATAARAAPARRPARMSACQAGWNSTSSRRWPKRSWVCSTGGCSLASTPQRIGSPPQNAPAACRRSRAQPPPSRSSASRSAAWSSKRLRPSRGGTWLRTSWVVVGVREHQRVSSVTERRQKATRSATSASASTSSRDRRRAGRRAPRPARRPGRRGELDVLRRAARRRRRPSRRTSLEAGGVGAAEGQALDLDGGVDGLGQQRPGQPPAAQRAAREGLDRGREPARRRAARPPRRRRAWRRPRAARRAGRPRRRGRPWTGSGGRRCPVATPAPAATAATCASR